MQMRAKVTAVCAGTPGCLLRAVWGICYAAEHCMGLHVSVANGAVANACYGISLFRTIHAIVVCCAHML